MGSISGIGAASAMWNSDNKSTTASSDNKWAKELQKIIDGNGTSTSSGDSSNSDGSKTTIERTVVMGPDGSMTVTLTQITTAPNGTQSSKVISTTKTGGVATYDDASEKSGKDALVNKTQVQGSLINSNLVSNVANEYDKNSDIGAYLSGAVLKKD